MPTPSQGPPVAAGSSVRSFVRWTDRPAGGPAHAVCIPTPRDVTRCRCTCLMRARANADPRVTRGGPARRLGPRAAPPSRGGARPRSDAEAWAGLSQQLLLRAAQRRGASLGLGVLGHHRTPSLWFLSGLRSLPSTPTDQESVSSGFVSRSRIRHMCILNHSPSISFHFHNPARPDRERERRRRRTPVVITNTTDPGTAATSTATTTAGIGIGGAGHHPIELHPSAVGRRSPIEKLCTHQQLLPGSHCIALHCRSIILPGHAISPRINGAIQAVVRRASMVSAGTVPIRSSLFTAATCPEQQTDHRNLQAVPLPEWLVTCERAMTRQQHRNDVPGRRKCIRRPFSLVGVLKTAP